MALLYPEQLYDIYMATLYHTHANNQQHKITENA